MKLLMLGVNHRTTPVELREQVALADDRLTSALADLRAAYPHCEVVILSTCNRTEIYAARPTHESPSVEQLIEFMTRHCKAGGEVLAGSMLQYKNEQVIAHLFRVCSGLDSMVLGESQIVGQVREAYETANTAGTVGAVLHRIFQQAIAVSKDVRTRTGIDADRVSVGSVAVDFARRIFGNLNDKVVVGLGAGDIAKLTLRHLASLRPARLWIANRTPHRAHALIHQLKLDDARIGVRPFEALDDLLLEADIIITGTGATEPIITASRLEPLAKRRGDRPLFIIDIAVPRDVDPRVSAVGNVHLYNIDDLQSVVAANAAQRSELVQQCETILAQAVRDTYTEIQNRDIGRLIKAFRQRLHDLGRIEQERTARKLAAASPDELPALLDEHTNRLINKILHLPLSQLDQRRADIPLNFYAAALRRLFDLQEDPTPHSDTHANLDDKPAAVRETSHT